MKRGLIIASISFCFIRIGAYGQGNLELVRAKFHEAKGIDDLDAIINLKLTNSTEFNQNIMVGYRGICTAMKAEYTFWPLIKLRYFNKGVEILENSIATRACLENIYLRLLLQLNTPAFLKYNENIENDLKYFKDNLPAASFSFSDKRLFIETLISTENKKYDIGSLRQIKIE